MTFNFNTLFCEESVLLDRYDLTAGLVHHIQLLFELFRDYKNVDDDKEIFISCILFVLTIHDFEIDLRDDALFMAIILFDENELNHRQMNIIDKFDKISGYYQERMWWL